MATRVPALIQLSDPRVAAQLVIYYMSNLREIVMDVAGKGRQEERSGGGEIRY